MRRSGGSRGAGSEGQCPAAGRGAALSRASPTRFLRRSSLGPWSKGGSRYRITLQPTKGIQGPPTGRLCWRADGYQVRPGPASPSSRAAIGRGPSRCYDYRGRRAAPPTPPPLLRPGRAPPSPGGDWRTRPVAMTVSRRPGAPRDSSPPPPAPRGRRVWPRLHGNGGRGRARSGHLPARDASA